ncbi:MAG TPA: aldo/keto reductase, partial [Acidimicrobiales bacterium]|nr:aldo/keto reductase [Acidimicrobiales bacterium]
FHDSQLYRDRCWAPALLDATERLAAVAADHGTDLLELTFSWLLAQPVVDGIVLGASSLEQLRVDLAALEKPTTGTEAFARFDGVWRQLRGPYPRYNR